MGCFPHIYIQCVFSSVGFLVGCCQGHCFFNLPIHETSHLIVLLNSEYFICFGTRALNETSINDVREVPFWICAPQIFESETIVM